MKADWCQCRFHGQLFSTQYLKLQQLLPAPRLDTNTPPFSGWEPWDLEVLILILTRSHQCELDVTAWWSQQDHIIRKKLRQGLGLCLCNLLCLKFSLINRISGEKSSPGGVQLPQEWGWLTAGNANQALTAVIQKLDCPQQQTNNNNIQSPGQEESWLLPGSHHLPPFNVEEQQLYFKHLLNDWTFFL